MDGAASADAPPALPYRLDSPPDPSDRDDDAGLAHRVQSLLTYEAQLLDGWRLDDWLALYDDPSLYIVPALNARGADPRINVAYVYDNRIRLAGRVRRLKSRDAHIENPASRTAHMVSNVIAHRAALDTVHVWALFAVHRSRKDSRQVYVGAYHYQLREAGDAFPFGLAIQLKNAELQVEDLSELGGVVSILL